MSRRREIKILDTLVSSSQMGMGICLALIWYTALPDGTLPKLSDATSILLGEMIFFIILSFLGLAKLIQILYPRKYEGDSSNSRCKQSNGYVKSPG